MLVRKSAPSGAPAITWSAPAAKVRLNRGGDLSDVCMACVEIDDQELVRAQATAGVRGVGRG